MASVYGGDEVNALVIDTGTWMVKAGYAGDDVPKAVFPSSVGVIPESEQANGVTSSEQSGAEQASKRQLFVGPSALSYRRDNMEVVTPFDSNELYSDWDIIESLWSHVFKERLYVNPSEFAMLLSEPVNVTKEMREKTVEFMFEKFQPPALFLAKNAVLSSFATARQTSLVVDAGYSSTTVAAVHDGYLLQRSVVRSPVAGRLLTQCMLQSVEARGAVIRPRYSFKRVERAGIMDTEVVTQPHTTASFREYHREMLAADIKESLCRTSDSLFVEEDNTNIPTVVYELPDGNEIHLGADRFTIPEMFFQPGLLSNYQGILPPGTGTLPSLPDLVMDCINKCDTDVRRELFNGVILTGGTSLFSNMRERLEKELVEAAPNAAKIKVIAPANNQERRFSVWIGGSIVASLGSFQQMWMSKAEYDEHGPSLIHRKEP